MGSNQRRSDTPPTEDLEPSFFRTWPLIRSSSQDHPLNTSQATTPISPHTVHGQLNLKKAALRKDRSETSQSSQDRLENKYPYSSPLRATSSTIVQEHLHSKLAKPSDAGLANDSRSSSISERARRLLRILNSQRSSTVATEVEPLQEAKTSYTWKREISGRFFEIRIGRKSLTEHQSGTNFVDTILVPPEAISTLGVSRMDFGIEKPHSVASTNDLIERSAILEVSQKEGLYCRTRRRLGLRQNSNDPSHDERRNSAFTAGILQRASTMLRDFAGKAKTTPSSSTSGSTRSIAAGHKRHPCVLPFYNGASNSSSSSIRNLKMGKPPNSTPDPDAMYTGSDNIQYFRVEMSAPGGPTYLPSEARRIITPPLSAAIQPHSNFFLDCKVRPNAYELVNSTEKNVSPTSSLPQDKVPKIDLNCDNVNQRIERAKKAGHQYDFELSVPEHLPSSPLCPKNPKHPSGGKGICVYHGRNKTDLLENLGERKNGLDVDSNAYDRNSSRPARFNQGLGS